MFNFVGYEMMCDMLVAAVRRMHPARRISALPGLLTGIALPRFWIRTLPFPRRAICGFSLFHVGWCCGTAAPPAGTTDVGVAAPAAAEAPPEAAGAPAEDAHGCCGAAPPAPAESEQSVIN